MLQRSLIDLRAPLRAAVDAHQARAAAHGLALELRELAVSVYVDADRQRLEQVFANLLTNAIKYTPRGERSRFGST